MTPSSSISTLILSGLMLFSAPLLAEKPVLSLVVDDLGYSFQQAKQVLELPGKHTFAIIPTTTYSQKIARYAHQKGQEIILHLSLIHI